LTLLWRTLAHSQAAFPARAHTLPRAGVLRSGDCTARCVAQSPWIF